jgi:hypothetical protein
MADGVSPKPPGRARGLPFEKGRSGNPAGRRTTIWPCLERILAPCRDRTVKFALPPIEGAGDIVASMKAVTSALAGSAITPGEAGTIAAVVDIFVRPIVQLLSWCSAFLGGSGSPKPSPDNSRLGAFNSRLSRRGFPVRSATGIRTQRYDLPNLLCRQMAGYGTKRGKIPVVAGKTGNVVLDRRNRPQSNVRCAPRHLPHSYPISGRGSACRSRRPRDFAEIR